MRAHSRCVSRVSLAALALLLAPAVAAVTPVKGSGLVAGAAPAAVRPSAPAAGSADAAALLAAAAREPDLAALVARVTALLQGEPLESAAAAPPPARAAAVPAAASAGALDVLPAAAAPPASAGALQLEKVEASVGRELQNNPCRTYTSCSPCASDYYCAWCSNAVGSPAYNCVNYNSGFAPAGCGNYAPDSSYCPGGSGGVSTPSASPYPGTGAVALSTSPTADSTRLLGAALGATLGIGAAAALLSAFLGVRFDAATASAPKPPAATQWAGQAAAAAPLIRVAHYVLLLSLALAVAAPIAPWSQFSSTNGSSTVTVVVSGLVGIVTTCSSLTVPTCTSITVPNVFGGFGAYTIFTAAAILCGAVVVAGVAAARLRAVAAGAATPDSDCCSGLVAAEGTGWFSLIWVIIGTIQLSTIMALLDALYRAAGVSTQVVSGGGVIAVIAIVLSVVGMVCVSIASCRARGVPGIGKDTARCCCTARPAAAIFTSTPGPYANAVPVALADNYAQAPGAAAYGAYAAGGAPPAAYGGGYPPQQQQQQMPGGYPQVGGAAGYPQAGGAAGYPQAYAGAAAAYGGGDPTQAPGGYYAPQPTQPGLPLPPQQQRYAYPALGAKGL